jgi:LCP family protein required for cell wall assembly
MSEELPPAPSRSGSRTWAQRLTIGAVFALAFGSFLAAGGLYAGQRIVEDRNIAPEILDPARNEVAAPASVPTVTDATGATVPAPTTPPTETFPQAEPDARNFLITGADNNACVDPNSPYAPAFGDRGSLGERSDTIMMWRVNPSTSQVAVLSFPRDLFVDLAGSSRSGRINEAYERDNPQRLIDTIYQNFGIPTDHFVQVDFCAFQTLVDAVDGVAVPFATPVRDPNTGLNVPEAGCFTFTGEHALAYVRSRYFEYQDEDGDWKRDPTSDLGRISRQQDFLRRTVSQLLDRGAYDPGVARGLIKTLTQYIVTDPDLTASKMLEFAGVMSQLDPTRITTYQIEADPRTIQGNAVLVPSIRGDNMQAILAVFRGEALLADIPEQVFETTVPPVEPPVAPPSSIPGATTVPAPPPGTTVPAVLAEENVFGIVPDENVTC